MSQINKEIISQYIGEMIKGVRPGWRRILYSPKVKPHWIEAMKSLNRYLLDHGVDKVHLKKNGLSQYIRPAENHIFECMKYFDPQNLFAIIVGQDPYTKAEEAQGLSFSVPPKVTIPPSLRTIFTTLVEQKLISAVPQSGNLVNWAKQGILLLNRYLTRSPNIQQVNGAPWVDGNGDSSAQYMHTFWGAFTDALIEYITTDLMNELNHTRHNLWILLWGKEAQKVTPKIAKSGWPAEVVVRVLEWGHPSGMSSHNKSDNPKNFKYCDHFTILAASGINWDPTYDPGNKLLDQFYHARIEHFDNWDAFFHKYLEHTPAKLLYNDGIKTQEDAQIKSILEEKSDARESEGTAGPIEGAADSTENAGPTSTTVDFAKGATVAQVIDPIVVGIDGGCTGNGNKNAVASYGIYFPAKFGDKQNAVPERKMSGIVPQCALTLTNGSMQMQHDKNVAPTNNRGELLAAIHAIREMISILDKSGPREIIIILDSEYVMHMINDRIWKWHESDPTFSGYANPDLVTILYDLLVQFDNKKYNRPVLMHQNSHCAEPKSGTTAHDMWYCNKIADELCTQARKSKRSAAE